MNFDLHDTLTYLMFVGIVLLIIHLSVRLETIRGQYNEALEAIKLLVAARGEVINIDELPDGSYDLLSPTHNRTFDVGFVKKDGCGVIYAVQPFFKRPERLEPFSVRRTEAGKQIVEFSNKEFGIETLPDRFA